MSSVFIATYRLQLHAEFGFDAAAAISDYLHQLGISHAYSSPYLQAAPGSQHGYDVVDHHKLNEELGGSEAYDRFCRRLSECSLGQVLDIVPNHMAISGRRNRLWWDVLENGPASRYASYFDVDWQSSEEKLRNKTLVPILGDHYGRVLNRGEITIGRKGGEFSVNYFDHELPLGPVSLATILAPAAAETGSDYLAFIADALSRLPRAASTSEADRTERHRDKEVIRGMLERLFNEVPFIADATDAVIRRVNRDVDMLDNVLERQNFRLSYWRTAEQELGYRRFFDVNTLIGLRMEDDQVFKDTHALILNWLREGVLDGIRADHPDGLRDPRQYFKRLREEAPNVWILAEKILEPGEQLRKEWPIDGTTGYDFLNQASGLYVDSLNEQAFTDLYSEFTGIPVDYKRTVRENKQKVMREMLGSDVNRLTSLFSEICEMHRSRRDYTRQDVNRAIRELVANSPVYRTYVVPHRHEINADDIRYIMEAVDGAKANRPELDGELFDFLGEVLTLKVRGPRESEFVLRFQQFTSPVMAKGVEDTVFYAFTRLVSLNEVGGDPGRFGVSPEQFHRFCGEAQKFHPKTMLASSTHDTKRSEDVRARLHLLSEIPDRWKAAVERWAEHNQKHKTKTCPDRNTEYFLYQTMLGAWPIGVDRLLPYMEKACREAKQQTSWTNPNEDFEKATRTFIEALYQDKEFLQDLESFVAPLIEPGRINSLSHLLLKLTAPGIPDMYQGTELWDLSLVDPDNRRPVDYEQRRRLLAELPSLNVKQVWERIDEGLPKLWVVVHAFRARRKYLRAFAGEYRPVRAVGSKSEHLISYIRGKDVMVLAPRLIVKLNNDWDATTIDVPSGSWVNELTGALVDGGTVALAQLLCDFPVALLTKK